MMDIPEDPKSDALPDAPANEQEEPKSDARQDVPEDEQEQAALVREVRAALDELQPEQMKYLMALIIRESTGKNE